MRQRIGRNLLPHSVFGEPGLPSVCTMQIFFEPLLFIIDALHDVAGRSEGTSNRKSE
jgi:hypothetical protein